MTNWTQPIDIYCERMGAGFWAEPMNACSLVKYEVAMSEKANKKDLKAIEAT